MVLDYQHVKPGKGGAFVRTKMKNMITGLMHEETFRSGEKFPSPERKVSSCISPVIMYEETFRSGEKFPSPDLAYRQMQYLYKDGELYNFMDQESYDQV